MNDSGEDMPMECWQIILFGGPSLRGYAVGTSTWASKAAMSRTDTVSKFDTASMISFRKPSLV